MPGITRPRTFLGLPYLQGELPQVYFTRITYDTRGGLVFLLFDESRKAIGHNYLGTQSEYASGCEQVDACQLEITV